MYRIFIAGIAALLSGGNVAAACDGPGQTRIDAIYPSGSTFPENILRVYFYFSGPMAEAEILDNITLSRADGTPVDAAFLSNRFDLWSPDRTRLTLLFDPARVKTGLEANTELGRALEEGEAYV
ncbi:MAG: hypothetical protein AAGO57_06985, partial [Pseudomonadota bacterium]